jgi:uncharacterized metal-binding protein YceD (DUF177 family)
MKLVLNTLPRGRSEQIFDSIAQLQQDDTIHWKPLELELILSIDRQDQNLYLKGQLKCRGEFICEAGMESFEDTLEGSLDVILTSNSQYMEDYDAEDMILIPAHENEFDLYPLVRDTVLLAIPISHVCGPDCKSAKILQKSLEADPEPDERWAKLKELFKE